MKKILLASIAAAALVSGADAASFNGFYAGASLGVAQQKGKFTNGVALGGTTAANQVQVGSFSLGTSNFSGTLFVGYGQVLANNIYVGAEIFGALNAGSVNVFTVGTTKLDVKSAPSFGAAARFGYLVTPQSLVFLSLGVASEGVKFNGNDANANPAAVSVTKRKVAFIPGVGFELAIGDSGLALRGDMTYSFGGKVDPSLALSQAAGKSSYEPRTLGVKLGVAYRF